MRWREAWRTAVRTARAMAGVADYEAYLAHHRQAHAGEAPLGRADFHRARTERRYGRGVSRCC